MPIDFETAQKIVNGDMELDGDVFDKLYDHYVLNGEMPYGVAKARDGDPYEWIVDQLASEFGL